MQEVYIIGFVSLIALACLTCQTNKVGHVHYSQNSDQFLLELTVMKPRHGIFMVSDQICIELKNHSSISVFGHGGVFMLVTQFFFSPSVFFFLSSVWET